MPRVANTSANNTPKKGKHNSPKKGNNTPKEGRHNSRGEPSNTRLNTDNQTNTNTEDNRK